MKSLNQPNYITKRENSLSLDGEWRFIWRDEKTSVKDLVFPYTAHLPNSVQYCLFEAGLLPHPYMSDSAEAYEWVDHKVWYFKREFFLPKKRMKDRVFLCCDGISYYSTLYVNGEEIGAHEGMFGGPYINIEQYLIPDAVNELIFEVVAPSRFPVKSMAKFPRKEIYPWAVDDRYDGKYFVVMGIWREVRLEFCDKIHLNRPFISTVRCNERTARLHLECDVCDERTDELKNASNHKEGCFVMSFDDGYPKNPYDSGYFVRTEVREKGTDKVVFDSEKPVEFYERGTCIYQNNVIMPYLFLEDFTIKNPWLWWPNGMGSPVLYDCKIELLNAAKNVVDALKFDFGIRTIGQEYTKAKKLYNPHEKFQFVVNGKKIFIKGCDFCNPDMLYKQDFEKIDWLISMVKNAGINLIRIWNGGNSVESDYFYECCDRNGIMVWQDLLLANNYDAHLWDCETAECQLSVNIQRVRNHPALAVYCGGNEYNENIFNCAQAVATTILTTQKNDFTRRLYITTPYAGSAHIYKDFEPTWFKKCYKELSFLSESGLAGFPDYKTYRKYIADKKGLDTFIFSEEKGITALENVICTSTGIDAYPATLEWTRSVTEINGEFLSEIFLCGNLAVSEFYRFMIEAMRSQYPKTTGVMPWTFNRFSVALMAYQCVDYEGVPTSVYYALKRAYKKVAFFADVSRLRHLPGENIVLSGSIVNEGLESNPVLAQAFIFNSAGEKLYFKEKTVSLKGYKQPLNFGTYTLDPKISNDCLFFAIRLISNDEVIYKSVYTLNYAFLILFMIVCFYPFWYVIIGSFSEGNVYNEGGVWLLPKNFNLSNYKMIIHDERLYIAYRNTLGRVFIGTATSILFTSCVAYAMSRRELPQRKIYRAVNVFTMFFSGGFIPYYLVITSLGFYDTFWVYVIPSLYSVSNMIVVSSFFCGIPEDLHEAAVIDGANEFIIWWGIYMPLSVPILSTVALWTAVGHWNAYFNTMVFTRDPQLITLQYYLLKVIKESSMPSGDHVSQAELDQVNATTVSFAAIVVATLPILFVYPYVAKKFTNDVMVGAVKG